MERLVEAILTSLENHGVIIDSGLIIVFSVGFVMFYKYVLKPLKEMVNLLAKKKHVFEIRDQLMDSEKSSYQAVMEKLEKINAMVDDISDKETIVDRDVIDIKKDVEDIRMILNQIQGHLMYSKPAGFGNRELK